MNKAILKKLLISEMNDEDESISHGEQKFNGNVIGYYTWMKQIDRVAPRYPYYYIGNEEVPFSEIYAVMDEIIKAQKGGV